MVSLCSSQSDVVGIYPTVIAKAKGLNEDAEVRILFDSCSNQSFVSPALAKKLQLPSVGKLYLNLNVFGKGRITKQVDNCLVTLQPLKGGPKLTLEAFITEVCEPIACDPVPIER